MSPRTGRRLFLGGSLAAAGAAVPLLQAHRAKGQAAQYPVRLVIMHTPNGVVPPAWRPTGGETNFTVSRILKPLEPHRSRLLVLGGVNMLFAESGPGSHHARGV